MSHDSVPNAVHDASLIASGNDSLAIASQLPEAQQSSPATAEHACSCQTREPIADQFVYGLGKIEMRFPTLGVEREFQQRELHLREPASKSLSRGERIARVLEANHHLATGVCYLLTMSGIPAYVLAPVGLQVREDLVRAVAEAGQPDRWCVAIGRRGPMANPSTCGGVLAPLLACARIYSFSLADWRESLHAAVGGALKASKIEPATFDRIADELFQHLAGSTENLGATDAHRALNYLLVQHPGVFLAAAERADRQTLDRIDTREIQGMSARKIVAAIFTFLDRNTGVPERLFCRVDVTEEWPFVTEPAGSGRGAWGLLPFVDTGAWGLPY
jgi:hypothetical protein